LLGFVLAVYFYELFIDKGYLKKPRWWFQVAFVMPGGIAEA
jgi:hypothetical protein